MCIGWKLRVEEFPLDNLDQRTCKLIYTSTCALWGDLFLFDLYYLLHYVPASRYIWTLYISLTKSAKIHLWSPWRYDMEWPYRIMTHLRVLRYFFFEYIWHYSVTQVYKHKQEYEWTHTMTSTSENACPLAFEIGRCIGLKRVSYGDNYYLSKILNIWCIMCKWVGKGDFVEVPCKGLSLYCVVCVITSHSLLYMQLYQLTGSMLYIV